RDEPRDPPRPGDRMTISIKFDRIERGGWTVTTAGNPRALAPSPAGFPPPPGDEPIPSPLRGPDDAALKQTLARILIGNPLPADSAKQSKGDMVDVGAYLLAVAFGAKGETVAEGPSVHQPICLELELSKDDSELQRLPWEMMHSQTFLAARTQPP